MLLSVNFLKLCQAMEALPFSWRHAPTAHCKQHASHRGGAGSGGPAEARMKGAHTQGHSILPSAPSFPANLGAPASLLLLGLPLG